MKKRTVRSWNSLHQWTSHIQECERDALTCPEYQLSQSHSRFIPSDSADSDSPESDLTLQSIKNSIVLIIPQNSTSLKVNMTHTRTQSRNANAWSGEWETPTPSQWEWEASILHWWHASGQRQLARRSFGPIAHIAIYI